jgi:dihydrofolate reductase
LRKLTAHMYTTLDGRAEFPKYPGEVVDPEIADPAFQEMWIDRYDSVDLLLFGRKAYEAHFAFWPPEKRTASEPKFVHDFSRWKQNVGKIVFSHSLARADWNNSRLEKGDPAKVVARLKSEPGKDMILEGGPNLTQQFIDAGLIDEYRLVVFPVIYGQGLNWFGSLPKQQTLKLESCKHLADGELVLRYSTDREYKPPAS